MAAARARKSGEASTRFEQVDVDDVVVLVDPERFGHLVLVIGVGLVEPGDPRLDRGDDLGRRPARRSSALAR